MLVTFARPQHPATRRVCILVATTLAAFVGGCTSRPEPVRDQLEPPQSNKRAFTDQKVVAPLDAGTHLSLSRPALGRADATTSGAGLPRVAVLHAWLREILATSPRFDIVDLDAGESVPDGVPSAVLTVAIDEQSGVWTTSLQRDGAPPQKLVQLEIAPTDVARGVSELAARSLVALGDTDASRSPIPTARSVYSQESACVLATERGVRYLRRGSLTAARTDLENALQVDGGSTFTLAALLAVQMQAGEDPDQIARRAQSALQILAPRTSPTTQHRLARLFWFARAKATADPTDADGKVLQLAQTALNERPHDPHVHYTLALALNLLGRYAESRPVLRDLVNRWPRQPMAHYHLCFAELATGKAEEALAAIRKAGRGLAPGQAVLPTVVALYETERFDELAKWLHRQATLYQDRPGVGLHEVRRMQASLAILRDRRAEAGPILLADIDWMIEHPEHLRNLAAHLAEEGEVLIRLGFGNEIAEPLRAVQDLQLDAESVGDATVYLAGLTLVTTEQETPQAALRELEQRGATAWHAMLLAAVEHSKGDIPKAASALGVALKSADQPIVRARMARALRAIGREDQADRLLDDLGRRVATIDLRGPMQHPVFSPGLALAVLAQTPHPLEPVRDRQ